MKYNTFYNIIRNDILNITKYGSQAPMYAQRIWVDVSKVRYILNIGKAFSGVVVDDFEKIVQTKTIIPVEQDKRIKSCIDRWVKKVNWADTEDYKDKLNLLKLKGKVWDGECSNLAELENKYVSLDSIYNKIKHEGRFKTRKEMNKYNFREKGTFIINIGPNGELYLDEGGYHRFAIALILKLEKVPAQIGCVDKNALGKLSEFRRSI